MLRWFLAIIAVPIVAVLGIVILVNVSPVTASKLIWPLVESWILRDDFVGVTVDGNVQEDLFAIESTGVSTEPVVAAANDFIDSLSEAQRGDLLFPVDDSEWRRWANIHLSTRQGVGFLDMDDSQSDAARGLLKASLSPYGYELADDIMKLEGHLADLMDDHVSYGEKRYWFTVMGEPSLEDPWGWQIDGHHLVINYFLIGDQVVTTPMFMGSEPVSAKGSRFGDVSILDDELTLGLQLINSLGDAERDKAIVEPVKAGNNNRGELFQDNAIVPYQGIKVAMLNSESQQLMREVVELYIGRIAESHAQVKLDEIDTHWEDTYFSWVGGTDDDSVFYYRIHSPVVMIEYDHQTPVALDGPDGPTREHVHTVIRTPNGNDYGKDLLRQHLAAHPH